MKDKKPKCNHKRMHSFLGQRATDPNTNQPRVSEPAAPSSEEFKPRAAEISFTAMLRMASSCVPVSNTKNGFTIMTQVVPGAPGSNISTIGPVQRLLKGEPKALGTVQIMIGITTLLFGILTTVNMFPVSFITGVTLWGPLFYITSGALSIAAGNTENLCLVKASLTLNVISSVVARIAIIVMSVGIVILNYVCSSFREYYMCETAQSLASGVSGVLLVFSLLEFIISICSSAFACKASCCPEITNFHINHP